VKLWFAGIKRENSKNCQVIGLQDVSQSYSNPTPTKEQHRSIPNEELKCNIAKSSSRWSKRIYQLPYSESRNRRYQSLSGVRWNGHNFLIRTPFDANYSFSETTRRRTRTHQRWAWSTIVGGRPSFSQGRLGWSCCQTDPASGMFQKVPPPTYKTTSWSQIKVGWIVWWWGTSSGLYKQPPDPLFESCPMKEWPLINIRELGLDITM
jgi:hypothetical protein